MSKDQVAYEGLADACAAIYHANPLYERFCAMDVCKYFREHESKLLFSCFEVSHVEAGEVFYESNTASDNRVRLIVDGEVSCTSPLQDTYIQLASGDVFGLFSFLDEGRMHSATLRAESDVVLLTISREYFNLITVEDPVLGNHLLRFMFLLLSRMSLKLENEYAAIHHYVTGRRG